MERLRRPRLAAAVAMGVGALVVVAVTVGGIALAGRGSGPGTGPAVLVGDDGTTSASPGPSDEAANDQGDNHGGSLSPSTGASCAADDDATGADDDATGADDATAAADATGADDDATAGRQHDGADCDGHEAGDDHDTDRHGSGD